MKFSQRIGKTDVRTTLQVESIDKLLQNRIWNTVLNKFFESLDSYSYYGSDSQKGQVCQIIWDEFFGNRTDEIPSYQGGGVYTIGFLDFLKKWFFSAKWYEVYDFVEFLCLLDTKVLHINFISNINQSLKKEVSGYRVIDTKIVQITAEEEIKEIEESLIQTSKFEPVQTHLKTSLNYLSERTTPNYRNSIKESISAVESFCAIITGDNDATLSKALTIIEKKWQIHGALKSAFSSLYGYTSDAGGIRHALLEQDIEITFEDAKFMLVSCSAFLNYLKIKIGK